MKQSGSKFRQARPASPRSRQPAAWMSQPAERPARRRAGPRERIAVLPLLLALGLSVWTGAGAAAQQTGDEWLAPINLSHSGAATNPQLVIDDQGRLHALWQDAFAGLMYAQGGEAQWSEPGAAFQFAEGEVQLASDGAGGIHAFWIDLEGRVFHSRAPVASLGDARAWSAPQLLAASAVALAVKSDDTGEIHLAYVDPLGTAENPAGIYYRRSADGVQRWRAPVRLFTSPYLRGIAPGEANVKLALAGADDETAVYVAWDHRPRNEVRLAISADGGLSWRDPVTVDRPSPDNSYQPPFNLTVGARGQQIALVWQVGQPDTGCSQWTQSSADGGNSWTEPQAMFGRAFSCALENHLVAASDGPLYLLTVFAEGVYLSAWDGDRWSEPQFQGILKGFEDPEAVTQVSLGCHRPALAGNRLWVIGCDENGGGDIWLTSRSLAGTHSWFGPPPAWGTPATIAALDGELSSPVLALDSQDRLHALWVQPATAIGPQAIFYARGERGRWSAPGRVLALPGEDIEHFSATISPSERLLVTWNGQDSGQMYFSWAGAGQALNAADWLRPQPLPIPPAAGLWPVFMGGRSQALHLGYSIPINEQRGAYLAASPDEGSSWLQPTRIFDGAASGWEGVGGLRLAHSSGGLHALFQRLTSPWSASSLGLFYARSGDGGQTWTEAASVADGRVTWSELLSDGDQSVHRLWQQVGEGAGLFFHEVSSDGGRSWSRAQVIPIMSTAFGRPAAALDPSGALHLIVIGEDTYGDLVLHHSRWDGRAWRAEERLPLGTAAGSTVKAVQASASAAGRLEVLIALSTIDPATRRPQDQLIHAGRPLSLTEPVVSELPSESAGQEPTAAPAQSLLESQPTPTVSPAALLGEESEGPVQGGQSDVLIAIGLAAGLAAALVATVFGARLLLRRGR